MLLTFPVDHGVMAQQVGAHGRSGSGRLHAVVGGGKLAEQLLLGAGLDLTTEGALVLVGGRRQAD
ncbi:MAG: hypothetical protein R2746_04705 [Acidimicrobiales bacterium]